VPISGGQDHLRPLPSTLLPARNAQSGSARDALCGSKDALAASRVGFMAYLGWETEETPETHEEVRFGNTAEENLWKSMALSRPNITSLQDQEMD